MKTEEIPEAEQSKLRLLKELPLIWHENVLIIIYKAASWEAAKKEICIYLSERQLHVKNVQTLFASKFPVGPQRKITRTVSDTSGWDSTDHITIDNLNQEK